MAKQENPFFNIDFQKMMMDFKMPGIDADALMNAQQKNIEAIASANQLATEGLQAIGKRQAELFQQTVEEAQKTLGNLMSQGAPEERCWRNRTRKPST